MEPERENLLSPEGVNAAVIRANVALTAELFEQMTKGQEAIVLAAFASGTVPERLAPVIKKRTESGVPVFLLSDNRRDSHGIRKTKYVAQQVVEEAGAIPLRTVNFSNLEEVVGAIREESLKGLRGAELGQSIYRRFDLEKKQPPMHGN